jgi:hypothetical protein
MAKHAKGRITGYERNKGSQARQKARDRTNSESNKEKKIQKSGLSIRGNVLAGQKASRLDIEPRKYLHRQPPHASLESLLKNRLKLIYIPSARMSSRDIYGRNRPLMAEVVVAVDDVRIAVEGVLEAADR